MAEALTFILLLFFAVGPGPGSDMPDPVGHGPSSDKPNPVGQGFSPDAHYFRPEYSNIWVFKSSGYEILTSVTRPSLDLTGSRRGWTKPV